MYIKPNVSKGTASAYDVGVANGVASLGSDGKVPDGQLPEIPSGRTIYERTETLSTSSTGVIQLTYGGGNSGYIIGIKCTSHDDYAIIPFLIGAYMGGIWMALVIDTSTGLPAANLSDITVKYVYIIPVPPFS